MTERHPQAVFKGHKRLGRRSILSSPLTWGAVAVAIGIGTLLMSGTRRPPIADSEPQAEAPVAPVAPKTEAEPAEAAAEQASAQRPGDAARRLIAVATEGGATPDLEPIYERAGERLNDGKVADAYLLYFFAARKGHAASAFALGRLYDPNNFSKEQSLLGKPDPLQARKWYRIAAKQGHNEARTRLLGLQDWVEARAQSGDTEAQRILLSWQ
jgi:TPR repeat protein